MLCNYIMFAKFLLKFFFFFVNLNKIASKVASCNANPNKKSTAKKTNYNFAKLNKL